VPLLKTNCNSRRGDFIMGITTYNCEDNAMGMLTYERRTCVRVTSYEKIKKKNRVKELTYAIAGASSNMLLPSLLSLRSN